MKKFFKLLSILFFTACATLSNQPKKIITLSDIEELKMGQSTEADALKLMGKPDEISQYPNNRTAWIYNSTLPNGDLGQKASLSFENGIVVGAVWLPYGADPFQDVKSVEDHFKGAQFAHQVEGWDKKDHFYSNDVQYFDSKNGIAFTVNGSSNTVMLIAVGTPEASRSVSSQSNTK